MTKIIAQDLACPVGCCNSWLWRLSSVLLSRTFILNVCYVRPQLRQRASRALLAAAEFWQYLGVVATLSRITNEGAQALYLADGTVEETQMAVYGISS